MDWSTYKDLINLATRAAEHFAERIKRRWDGQKKVLRMDVRNCVGIRHLLAECIDDFTDSNQDSVAEQDFADSLRNPKGFTRGGSEASLSRSEKNQGLSKDKLDFYIVFARLLRHRLRIKLCMMLEGVTVMVARKGTYLKVYLTQMSFYEQRAWLVHNTRTEIQHFDLLCS